MKKFALTLFPVLASILILAQPKSTPAQAVDSTKIEYDLGAPFESLLKRQEELAKQYEESEKVKQPFIVGYLAGRGKTMTPSDSLVWIDKRRFRIIKKPTKK